MLRGRRLEHSCLIYWEATFYRPIHKGYEQPSYARVLVEVEASKPLEKEISFQLPGSEVVKQPVIYEMEPKACLKCKKFWAMTKKNAQGNHSSQGEVKIKD